MAKKREKRKGEDWITRDKIRFDQNPEYAIRAAL